jgi:aryl-alcohol dehydrogenase-like predicted oxidoreductase
MRTRTLGKSGLVVSELSLGTWGLSGEGYGLVSDWDADKTIEKAVELGITLFETADCYGRGKMEERLGRALEKHAATTFVATRHGTDRRDGTTRRCFEPTYLKEAFAASQERLRREVLDVYLLHNPTASTMQRDDVLGFCREQREAGRVKAWGVSAGDAEVAKLAIEAGADVVSFAYNVFNAPDLTRIEEKLRDKNVGLLAHSVLAYGLLAGLWPPEKTFQDGDHRRDRWTKAELRGRMGHLSAVRSLVAGDVFTVRAASLRYVLTNLRVTSAVLGPRNPLQLEQLVREGQPEEGRAYLDEERLTKLPAKLREQGFDLG